MKFDLRLMFVGFVFGMAVMWGLQEALRAHAHALVRAQMEEDAKDVKCTHEGDETVCRWKREVTL